jgi:hypothetical protein
LGGSGRPDRGEDRLTRRRTLCAPLVERLSEPGHAGGGDDVILMTGAAADTDGADQFAVGHERQTAGRGAQSIERQEELMAVGERFRERFVGRR